MVSVSLTLAVPLDAGSVIPATNARLQANVAPAVALVAVYVNGVPLQIAAGDNVLLNTGEGFTVIVYVWSAPAQFGAAVIVGLTLKVTVPGAVVVLVSGNVN